MAGRSGDPITAMSRRPVSALSMTASGTWASGRSGTCGPGSTTSGGVEASGTSEAARPTAMRPAGSATTSTASASSALARRRVQITMPSAPRISTARKAKRARLLAPGPVGPLGTSGDWRSWAASNGADCWVAMSDTTDWYCVSSCARSGVSAAVLSSWVRSASRSVRSAVRLSLRWLSWSARPCVIVALATAAATLAVSSAFEPVTVTVTVPDPTGVDALTRRRMSSSVVPLSATAAPLVSTASLPTRRS